jgi:integrase
MPFTQAEMVKMLVAFDKYSKRAGVSNTQRLKAFVLLLRYSGMRIGDAVTCGVDRIAGDNSSCIRRRLGSNVCDARIGKCSKVLFLDRKV